MKRMKHPQHGWQMVQPADVPMFERAGWTEHVDQDPVVADEPEQQKPEPAKPRKRRVKNDDSL